MSELAQSEARTKPVAALIVGQAGAGNSALAHDIADGFSDRGGFVSIDARSLRTHLPYYEELSAADAEKETEVDASRLADALRKCAVEGSRNIIVESGATSPDDALRMTQELKSAGYQVELHALAVNDQISYERAAMRHELDLEAGVPASRVSHQAHDGGFRSASDTVRRLEFSGAVDRVVVYNRLNDAVIDQPPIAGRVVAGEAFDNARTQLTNYERIALAEKWDTIIEKMETRGAPASDFDQVKARFARAHYTLHASPEAAASYSESNPTERHKSASSAQEYGTQLVSAFREGQRAKAAEYPELQSAFAAQAAATRYAEQQTILPAGSFHNTMQDLIAAGLRRGEQLQVNIPDKTTAPTLENAAAQAR